MTSLFLIVALLLLTAKLFGHLSVRLGFPSVLGEILAGVLFSASALDILSWPLGHDPAALTGEQMDKVLSALAELGVLFLMFIAGLETDLEKMRKVGGAAFWAAVGGVLLPFLGGAGLARWAGRDWPVALFIGTLLTATSVSITAQTLMEMGQLKSREGSCTLGAAIIDDVLGVLVLSLVVATAMASPGSGSAFGSLAKTIGLMGLFFAGSIWLGRRFFGRLLDSAAGLKTTQPAMTAALVACLLYSWSAEVVGQVAAITGAYIAGALFGLSPRKEELTKRTEVFAYSFFVPLFLAHVGLQTRFGVLGDAAGFATALLLIAIVAKVVGCGAGALAAGFTPRESLRVGVGMMSRGEVGLIIASYGLSRGIIDQTVFAEMVLVVLITTLLTPIGLKLVFPKTALEQPV